MRPRRIHALGLVYNWNMLPRRTRIKQLYMLKNITSAVGFLLTCFVYPLIAGGVIQFSGWHADSLATDTSVTSLGLAMLFLPPLNSATK